MVPAADAWTSSVGGPTEDGGDVSDRNVGVSHLHHREVHRDAPHDRTEDPADLHRAHRRSATAAPRRRSRRRGWRCASGRSHARSRRSSPIARRDPPDRHHRRTTAHDASGVDGPGSTTVEEDARTDQVAGEAALPCRAAALLAAWTSAGRRGRAPITACSRSHCDARRVAMAASAEWKWVKTPSHPVAPSSRRPAPPAGRSVVPAGSPSASHAGIDLHVKRPIAGRRPAPQRIEVADHRAQFVPEADIQPVPRAAGPKTTIGRRIPARRSAAPSSDGHHAVPPRIDGLEGTRRLRGADAVGVGLDHG